MRYIYISQLETTCHVSHCTCQVSNVRCQVSHVTCQVLHVTFHPFPNRNSQRPEIFPYYSRFPMCPVSLVQCYMSGVTCQLLCVTIFICYKVAELVVVALFSTEPTPSTFLTFSNLFLKVVWLLRTERLFYVKRL